jgi:hypothetical protein
MDGMVNYKQWIANQLRGKKVRFKCDCLVQMDITGTVVDADASKSEIVYTISTDGRFVKIGENTPKLQIEIL